jgi:hypothetical protein
MTVKANRLEPLIKIIERIKLRVSSMETLYKLLKIKKAAEEEILILNEQREIILKKYAEFDSCGRPIVQEGKIKIKEDYRNECAAKLLELNSLSINLPDLLFSAEEFNNLGINVKELFYLIPFIKF